jgi:hypothetical protein
MTRLAAKDPEAVDFYYVVWCSKDGTNDGGADDTGRLQGATIATSAWAISPALQLIEDAENTAGITIKGVVYAVDTVATIKVSAGTAGSDYALTNTITTDDGRTLEKTITLRVRHQ